DLEMALRLQKAGYLIENAPRARVYTKAPTSVRRLLRQRTRWTTGFMRNTLNEYRDLVGSRKYGALGTIVLPIGGLAIVSGMMLFGVTSFLLARRIVHSYFVHQGVPFSFSLPSFTFDWFYLPLTLYIILAVFTIGTTLALIVIGKRIS